MRVTDISEPVPCGLSYTAVAIAGYLHEQDEVSRKQPYKQVYFNTVLTWPNRDFETSLI